MKKKLAVVMALVLLCGCIFAACGKDETNPAGEEGTTETEFVKPIAVSHTQYLYATNPDGSYETVVATDAEGNTKTYLKGVKPAETNAANSAAQEEDSALFEVATNPVLSSFTDILKSGNFEIQGYMTAEGEEKLPLSVLVCGSNNLRMGTELAGIAVSVVVADDTVYLVSDKTKSYIEMTDSITKSLGFDKNELVFDGFGNIGEKESQAVRSDATYNGKAVDCYTTTAEDGSCIKFYIDGDKMVKFEMYEPNGVCTTMIETTVVRGGVTLDEVQIPADYTKKSYAAFVADLMGL